MLVTDALTIGQTTFILRVAIQIISYGGLFLIALLILANTPRVASVKTHDLLNRIVGKSTLTKTSVKWVWDCIRGRNSGPAKHTQLLVAIILLTLYELFTTLSDIGFLGFHTCSVPGPSSHDYPASINTDQLAQSAILANLVNGTEPSTVTATRCDSVVAVELGPAGNGSTCDAWHTSTWANASFFAGLNMTDSDTLMPRQLGHYNNQNSFFLGPGSTRVESPTISGGMAVNPHATGFQVVFGVPQLGPQQKVTLEKAIALEVDMGCVMLGVSSTQNLDNLDPEFYTFQTNGSWRQYAGPDYLHDVLSQTADVIRQYLIPSFNVSSLSSDGSMVGINGSETIMSPVPHVGAFYLPDIGKSDGDTMSTYIFGNCTNKLRDQLNLTEVDSAEAVPMCGVYGVGGLVSLGGQVLETDSEMVCATASQVNMVSATIQTDAQNAVSVQLTRLPSDLNYLRSSNYSNSTSNPAITIETQPIERYTLSDNTDGLTSHFIVQYNDYYGGGRMSATGSGGTSFSRAGSFMIDSDNSLTSTTAGNLLYLDPGINQLTMNATTVTQWGGQVGASFILASTTYNGWAARDSVPMVVLSTGGKLATCYHPLYALGFLPLILAALFVVGWFAFVVFTSGFRGSTRLQKSYGGINTLRAAFFPNLAPKNTLLIWENTPEPQLKVVSQEEPLPMNYGHESAQSYLQARSKKDQSVESLS